MCVYMMHTCIYKQIDTVEDIYLAIKAENVN